MTTPSPRLIRDDAGRGLAEHGIAMAVVQTAIATAA
jgi:hypothetical protein